ncbi:sugar kinase [Pseudonocardia sp. RS11V-5]|uniref:sugar kinase n=1 Tax=Pseudonocardia terrae TaxID=2905831 RepID=UPI001E511240|nr:sugar kinase [Pseudonocardia terrae]MCE3551000.1 sugar kinase [Pseudonocardia terrae]
MSAVLTLGETMGLLTPQGRLAAGSALAVGIGGAESNVAIGLARLGVDVTWVSRVGDDDLGRAVVREIRAEGVRVLADPDPAAPTGMMLKELRGGRTHRVRYYRAGSAASRLAPAHVDAVAPEIGAARVLHLTGITPALGPGPRAAVARAVGIAREAGVLVSLDVNHRRTLWSDAEARAVLGELVPACDLVFAGPEEAALVLGVDAAPDAAPVDAEGGADLAARLAKLGSATAVVKLGPLGAVAHAGGTSVHAPTRPVEVVDAVGAGDAFVAGYLAELVEDRPVEASLALGNAAGGAVCLVHGDWEGLPTRAELAALQADPPTDVLR